MGLRIAHETESVFSLPKASKRITRSGVHEEAPWRHSGEIHKSGFESARPGHNHQGRPLLSFWLGQAESESHLTPVITLSGFVM